MQELELIKDYVFAGAITAGILLLCLAVLWIDKKIMGK